MKKSYLILLLSISMILTISFSCRKLIGFGRKPERINNKLISNKGKLLLDEEKILVKYVISDIPNKRNKSNDIIFYFHGLGRTELEWVENNGFGEIFNNIITSNPNFTPPPVVSISIGSSFFFLEDAPPPFSTDLETVFIKKIIPYFKNLLNVSGNVFLVGHSMGGFNVLTLSLRNPKMFPVVVTISPFVAPLSPFQKEFEQKGEELNMPKFQISFLKRSLTNAFGTEKKWNEYNPFYIVKNSKEKSYPYIILSSAEKDLPGFAESINDFAGLLKEKNISFYYCKSAGDHKSTCENVFFRFLKKIS